MHPDQLNDETRLPSVTEPETKVRVTDGELKGREGTVRAATGWLPSGCVEVYFDGDPSNTGLPTSQLKAIDRFTD